MLADRRVVQAHMAGDFGQRVPVIEDSLTYGLVAARFVTAARWLRQKARRGRMSADRRRSTRVRNR